MTDQPAPVDLDDLRRIHALRHEVAELEQDVTDLRSALIRGARLAGMTWREIGEVFDVTPQRAHEMARIQPTEQENTP